MAIGGRIDGFEERRGHGTRWLWISNSFGLASPSDGMSQA